MSVKDPRLLIAMGFILGIIISIGEFLCTGQIYLLTLVYIMQISSQFDVMTVLSFLLYGLALIVPMILLLFIIHKGKEVFEVSELVRKNFQYIKLLNACVFLVFGIIIIFVL
jgi:ABC-type nickel/cobalt efflux system permease component RcnA